MHAHLFISPSPDLTKKIEELSIKIHTKIMEFPLQKIEDARNLNNLIRLSFEEPTLIVSKDIHNATEEALNAFLKNLEEPQENIYFALTAPSIKKVLSTIVSRCQIIIVKQEGVLEKNEATGKFLKLKTGEKLSYIDKIKDRERALELAEDTVNILHSQLHSDGVKYNVVAQNLELATKTYSRLKANGNVNLQLVNFVLNYQNG